MILPTCPSCGQSVLDDDVEECPFCNAAMPKSAPEEKKVAAKPKPSAAKTPPPATPPTPAPQKTKESRVKKKSSSKKSGSQKKRTLPKAAQKKTPSSPMPEISSPLAGTGILLVKHRSKENRYPVVCPMCETTGFAPKSASGREVRCVNPECMVPLFEAPRLKIEKQAEEAPPRPLLPIVSGSVVLLAVVGTALWFFVFKEKDKPIIVPNNNTVNNNETTDHNKIKIENDDDKNKKTTPVKVGPPKIKYPTFAEIQKVALHRMIPAAQEIKNNRSKPYCRQQTAMAFIEAGDLKGARAEIEQLVRVKPFIPFYQIVPLTTLAWKQIASGAKPKGTVEEAFALRNQIPQLGEDAFEAKIKLATLLIAVNREEDALELIEKEREEQMTGRFVTSLLQTETVGNGDFDSVVQQAPIQLLHQSQWSAVAMLLTSHLKYDTAVQWTQKHPDLVVRAETFALYLEQRLAQLALTKKPPELSAAATKLFSKLITEINPAPATEAYLSARLALQQYHLGDREGAKQRLIATEKRLATIKIPAALVRPDMKEIYEGHFAETTELKITAVSFAELARLEALLSHPEKSWNLMKKSLACLRAMTPSPQVCSVVVSEIDAVGVSYYQSKLKSLLKLKNDDLANQAFKKYRKHCRELNSRGEARFQLQTMILAHATTWKGLPQKVWQEVNERTSTADEELFEPHNVTSLRSYLLVQFDPEKEGTIIEDINYTLGEPENQSSEDRLLAVQHSVSKLFKKGEISKIATRIDEERHIHRTVRTSLALRIACQLIKQKKLSEAIKLAKAFKNPLLRESSFKMIATLATRSQQGQPFWELCKNLDLPSTEQIALYRGMISGIITNQQPPPEKKSEEKPEPSSKK